MQNSAGFKKGGAAPNSFNRMPEGGESHRGLLDILAIIVEDIMDL